MSMNLITLLYLVASGAEDGPAIAYAQYSEADNMTERQSALATLASKAGSGAHTPRSCG